MPIPGSYGQPRDGRRRARSVPVSGALRSQAETGGRVETVVRDCPPRIVTATRSRDNARRGRQSERICRPRERSKPLKGKAQGRHRRETKPEGLREEEDVKRLRKPEGVAQPGEANPAQVASRCLMRRRAGEPQEGRLHCSSSVRVILWSGAQVHERPGECVSRLTDGHPGRPQRPVRKTKAREGGPNQ